MAARHGGIATTGAADLAGRAGCSTRWIEKALGSLRKKKLNEVARKGRSGRYVSTYRITTRLPVAGPKAANPGDSTG